MPIYATRAASIEAMAMMRRSPPGFSCLLGLDQRRKRPLTDMTPEEEETTEAGQGGWEQDVITLVVAETSSTGHVACRIDNHSEVFER